MLKNKRILAIVMTLMMVFSVMPGMAFADSSSVKFDIVDKNGTAITGAADVDMAETAGTQFGVKITEPADFSGEYHVHYGTPTGGGNDVVAVAVNTDGKTFIIKGNRQGSASREITLVEGVNCGTNACGNDILGETKLLSLNVINSQDIANPTQGKTQTLKLANYKIDVLSESETLIVNRILSKEENGILSITEGENVTLNFVVTQTPKHIGKAELNKYMGVYKKGSTEKIGTLPWGKVEDGVFFVTIGDNLEAGEYVLRFEPEFCVRDDRPNDLRQLKIAIEFEFIVAPPVVEAEAITLDKESMELTVGETGELTATVTPEDTTDKTVTWESSDATVATVDEEGKVTAVKAGTATITAKTANGLEATCAVTVKAAPVAPPAGSGETQTGDYTNMMPYFMIMLAAMAVATGTVVYRRQRQ